jgi:hypothetical protein
MVCKTLIQMEKIAQAGAKKMADPASGYTLTEMDGTHFKVTNPEDKSYIVVPSKNFCRCLFHRDNRKTYGPNTTCKHLVWTRQYQADEEARIAEMAEREERMEEYRFDADPFH